MPEFTSASPRGSPRWARLRPALGCPERAQDHVIGVRSTTMMPGAEWRSTRARAEALDGRPRLRLHQRAALDLATDISRWAVSLPIHPQPAARRALRYPDDPDPIRRGGDTGSRRASPSRACSTISTADRSPSNRYGSRPAPASSQPWRVAASPSSRIRRHRAVHAVDVRAVLQAALPAELRTRHRERGVDLLRPRARRTWPRGRRCPRWAGAKRATPSSVHREDRRGGAPQRPKVPAVGSFHPALHPERPTPTLAPPSALGTAPTGVKPCRMVTMDASVRHWSSWRGATWRRPPRARSR